MIVVLNKVDMIPPDERDEKIEKMKNKLRKVFSTTKFADPVFVLTSAAVGGEKVAAVVSSATGAGSGNKGSSETSGGGGGGGGKSKKGGKAAAVSAVVETTGVDTLIEVIRSSIRMPRRNYDGPFYFAIDHCFPIKGHGTVLTGTILSGSIQINSTVELPLLQQQRKVKSMQMFRKPVKAARQGDRLGLCVANLDAKLVERGIATTPSSVPLLSTVICLVKKVRFFKFPCKSNTKFHITIGHTTVNATAVFFGKQEILEQLEHERQEKEKTGPCKSDNKTDHTSSLSAYHTNFPKMSFPWDQDFEYQDELEGAPTGDMHYGNEPLQWVLLQFQQPVYCPLGSLIIGSRLETIEGSEIFAGGAQHCRLSFYGPIVESMTVAKPQMSSTGKAQGPNPLEALKLFRWKQKECDVHRVIDVRKDRCMEAIGYKLYSKEAGNSIKAYLGMKLQTSNGDLVGVIHKAFGSTNKFRIRFPHGAVGIKAGTKLFLRFKRYVYDSKKLMQQTGMELTVPPDDDIDLTFDDNDSEEYDDDDNDDDEDKPDDKEQVEIKVEELNDTPSTGVLESHTPGREDKPSLESSLEAKLEVKDNSDGSSDRQKAASLSISSKKTIGISLPSGTKATTASATTATKHSSKTTPAAVTPASNVTKPQSITDTKTSSSLTKKATPSTTTRKTGSKGSYEAIDLTSVGQKRASAAASSGSTKTNISSSQNAGGGRGNINAKVQRETVKGSVKSTGSWVDITSNKATGGAPNRVTSIAKRDNKPTTHDNVQVEAASPQPRNSSGPHVKAGYQQHILAQMAATNPYINQKTHKSPTVTPASNLKFNYTAPLPSPPKITPTAVPIKSKRSASSGGGSQGSVRTGTIDSIKQTPDGSYVAIVSGAFRMEENIRLFAGAIVLDGKTGSPVGELLGPFSKMGKCKVQLLVPDENDAASLPALKSSLSIVLPPDAVNS